MSLLDNIVNFLGDRTNQDELTPELQDEPVTDATTIPPDEGDAGEAGAKVG